MDTEDRDHFKTMSNPSQRRLDVLKQQQKRASSASDPDLAYCLKAAQTICGCYRRDEAHAPDIFAAALGAVLSEFPRQVVDYVADPRTGVITDYPMGLPNVGQIRSLCVEAEKRMDRLAAPQEKLVVKRFVPPPLRPGQIDSDMHAAMVKAGTAKPRALGPFEEINDQWNRGL